MKFLKTFFKSIDVAFSIYSKIPMPRFNWGSEDMRYHLCFFPWVGLVIGALEWGWYQMCLSLTIPQILQICLAIVIPLLVTGGFHVDGYMDTMDALHSYQSKEKKLEILKDPHIGAFAVIQLILYFLLMVGFASLLNSWKPVAVAAVMFYLSRCMSGISVVSFPSAKKDGMLKMFSSTAQQKAVAIILLIQLIIGMAGIFLISWKLFLVVDILSSCVYLYYFFMSRKQFGGITGDLCGFFVSLYELVIVIGLGSSCFLGWY